MTKELSKKELIAFRAPTLDDENFIYSTWLKGLRYGNELFSLIDQEIYFKTYHVIIEFLLKHPTTRIEVAALKEDPEVILGYVVRNQDTVHWLFVKQAWRGIGLARSLLSAPFEFVSHLTDQGASLLKQKYPTVKFNPFIERK
jgi:GNAT superfamily N-acetyltransferase